MYVELLNLMFYSHFHNKAVSNSVETTPDEEEVLEKKSMVVPIPVPFYMPAPTTPCLLPSTHPVPIPLPNILPCPIPASRTSVGTLIKQLEQQLLVCCFVSE